MYSTNTLLSHSISIKYSLWFVSFEFKLWFTRMLWLKFLVLSLSIVLLSAMGIPLSPPGARLKLLSVFKAWSFARHASCQGTTQNSMWRLFQVIFLFFIHSKAVIISMPNNVRISFIALVSNLLWASQLLKFKCCIQLWQLMKH
jgi:hypothetical protein